MDFLDRLKEELELGFSNRGCLVEIAVSPDGEHGFVSLTFDYNNSDTELINNIAKKYKTDNVLFSFQNCVSDSGKLSYVVHFMTEEFDKIKVD